jgi:hypothetical protein
MIKSNEKGLLITLALVLALMLIPGCTGNYGRLKSNPDLTAAFQDRQTLPDFNYYYCGREDLPYAVVGIDPRYEFQDRFWHPIETKEDVYRKAAGVTAWDNIWSRGADILDAEGNRIGIWFSYYDSTTVKLGPDNKVAVYNPYNPNKPPKGNYSGAP